jgi:hypothetical protein
MENLSREYAKFKRLFVGPTMPRRVIKERFYSVNLTPADPRPRLAHRDIRKLWDNSAMKKYAMPAWADKDAIQKLYEEARRLTKETGVKHEVDHIVPIRHPLVCGFHIENNLRVIPAEQNNRKSNKFLVE